MNNKESCRDYFKKQKAFERCFLFMKKKWESYGRTAGRITWKEYSQEEKNALEGLLGRSFQGESISFSLREFEDALQETRFAGVTLKELLEAYFGEELRTNAEKRELELLRKRQFLEAGRQYFREKMQADENGRMERTGEESLGTAQKVGNAAYRWITAVMDQKAYGYSGLMSEFERDSEAAQKLLWNVGDALVFLEMLQENGTMPPERSAPNGDDAFDIGSKAKRISVPYIRLAVLAARLTGNPHYFDRAGTAGTVFVQALCCWMNREPPQNAQETTALYFKGGILTDDMSSTVIAFGLHLETERGLHPAFEGFIKEKEPCVISLANLAGVRRAYGDCKYVFAVENEMVFSHMVDELKDTPATLLCVSGQPRVAALVLLDLLAAEEMTLFYAGDLDPEGLGIANRIWKRHPDRIRLWHMSQKDYVKSRSEEKMEERRLAVLKNLESPLLCATAKLLEQEKCAGYQERLLEEMIEDVRGLVN